MSATRPAQPGDLFFLLEPSEAERAAVRNLQAALQARYGGQPQEYIHLTCQRFSLQGGQAVERLVGARPKRQFKEIIDSLLAQHSGTA